MAQPAPVIWWTRRDLRVDDNPALAAALATGGPVVPLFVWAPEEEGQFQQGRYSRWWTKHTVTLFQQQIEHLGGRLIIRRASETARGLMQVVKETGARAVFFNHLYDPISLVRDHEVKAELTKMGIECSSFNADLLYEPWEVLDQPGHPYTCFDGFWNRVLEMPTPPPFPLPAPTSLPTVSPALFSVPLHEVDWFFTKEQEASSDQLKFKWKPGVEGAVEKLEAFLAGQLHTFEHDRAKVDRHSTSSLSPWIHTGTISVRYIFYRVCQRQAELRLQGVDISRSCRDFLQQLGYREYSRYLSFHFPFIHERSLLAHLRACPWRMDQHHFKAWRQGQTGYPLVDAAMRELWATGWCHNRLRVVAASFMVKHLLLPWQWGLKHYWDAQMDADLECDALGWQYVSGGMTDAHPFNRLMDLDTEAQRFDPDGEYVRRWLPVLSRLPTQHIHAPWSAPPEVLLTADVELGFNYPQRIITAEESRVNMEYACRVLESCASGSTKQGLLSHPYRAPTVPLSRGPGLGPSEGTGPAGVDGNTRCRTPAGMDGRAPASGSQPDGGAGSAPQAPQAPAGVPPPPWAARRPAVVYGRDAEERASVRVAPARPGGGDKRNGGDRERPRGAARAAREEMGGDSTEEYEEGGDAVGEVVQPGGRDAADGQSGSSGFSDDDEMSEVVSEVVSNTAGLSAPQASAWSGRQVDEAHDRWHGREGREDSSSPRQPEAASGALAAARPGPAGPGAAAVGAAGEDAHMDVEQELGVCPSSAPPSPVHVRRHVNGPLYGGHTGDTSLPASEAGTGVGQRGHLPSVHTAPHRTAGAYGSSDAGTYTPLATGTGSVHLPRTRGHVMGSGSDTAVMLQLSKPNTPSGSPTHGATAALHQAAGAGRGGTTGGTSRLAVHGVAPAVTHQLADGLVSVHGSRGPAGEGGGCGLDTAQPAGCVAGDGARDGKGGLCKRESHKRARSGDAMDTGIDAPA